MRLDGDPTIPAKPNDIIKASRGKNGKVGGVQSHDYIRVTPGDPACSVPIKQKTYVHIRSGGKTIASDGSVVESKAVTGTGTDPRGPFAGWQKWPNWNSPR